MNHGPSDSAFVRAFIAVEAADAVRDGLAAVIEDLRKTRAHVAWVPRANIHVSLAFLGNIAREQVDLLSDALDEAAAPLSPFTVRVRRVGVFGKARSPRVVWAGIDDEEPLQVLYRSVTGQLDLLEMPIERRSYVPHLTLGRVRSRRNRDELLDALAKIQDFEFGEMAVQRVVLMQSRLLPQSAEYSVLRAAELRG